MSSNFQIIFLGTGGGRFVTMTQRRRTAGIRILNPNLNIHLDPGPGALVYSISEGLNPQKLDGVLVSHCHPDHYTDAEVLIEAMTRGMTRKRGVLAAAKSVLRGGQTCEASISRYHQEIPEQRIEATPKLKFKINSIGISATEARHTDPDAVGFRFETEFGDFSYTSDTEYFDGIARYYEGSRLLIPCVMRASGRPWKGHMTTDDAVRIVEESHPELAVMTHLGMGMLAQGPAGEARTIQEKTGVQTVAATDGLVVNFGEKLTMQVHKKDQQGLMTYF